MPNRYYAEYTEIPQQFQSSWTSSWLVFDRELAQEQGNATAIAFCSKRSQAFKIRDALNASVNVTEKEKA